MEGGSQQGRSTQARRAGQSRGRVIGAALAVGGLAALGALAWHLTHRAPAGPGGPGGPGGGRRPTTTVGVAMAKNIDIPITIEALGAVTPPATATVRPQVAGVITQILFREGQMVEKGQTLAVIDPRPFQLALGQAQGNLARDEAQLQVAQLTLTRYRTLLTQDSIARQDVDTQAATVKQLQGVVATDRAAVGSAQLNLGYSRIAAPVSGRIGLRVVDMGNYIAAGDAAGVAVITQVNPIDVEFSVPQDDLPRIQARVKAGAAIAVTALDRTRTTTLGQGQFLTLDNQVDAATGTVKAKARFANGDGALFPNQFVNVRMLLDTLSGAVVVPAAALRHGPQGDFVYVLNQDRTVSLRAVTRGPGSGDNVSITQGLKLGERVVTEGGDRLTDGARVQLPGDKPHQGGPGGPGGGGRRHGGGAAQAGAPPAGQPASAQQAAPGGDGQGRPPGGWRHRQNGQGGGGQNGGGQNGAGQGQPPAGGPAN
ncbi:multidrug transporter subunit MdtA [Caulobacter sp. CCUG 60055]|nr:MdtA/MuxA family multidrug efflux RND transporter periplasmic adaptor subunit [Caulobacteraceae bacterium]MCI3179262.1 multidrug transporter subunit MdtA [Caulobacter sp. CCUG 60055]